MIELVLDSNETIAKVEKMEVPNIPNAFCMKNVLSNKDCDQLIALSEQMGYRPDMPEGQDDERAMGCVFLASDTLNNYIFDRCREVLPLINQDPALGKTFSTSTIH